jgi:CHAT domain-containing protein/tetratricopeptide (TPR) repeat protein
MTPRLQAFPRLFFHAEVPQMSRGTSWLSPGYILIVALCLNAFQLSFFFPSASAQTSSQPDLTQPEIRQVYLRQMLRLGMQAEHEQLRTSLVRLRALAEQKTDKGTLATVLITETLSLALQNKLLEALATYRKIPPLAEIESDRRALAYVLSLRAFLGYYRNDFKQVRADAERSLALSDPTTEQPEIAFTLSALSLAQLAERQLDEAEKSLRQSLALGSQLPDQALAALPLNNLGLLAQYRDEPDVALKHFGASLVLCQQYRLRTLQHYVLKNLGDAALQLNQNQQALDFYQQSLNERQSKGPSRELATIWRNLASAHLALNQYRAAVQALEQCLTIEIALGDQQAEALRSYNIGAVYVQQEDYGRALEYLQKSLALAETRQQVDTQGRAALEISYLMITQNNAALAHEYLQKALRAAEASKDRELLRLSWLFAGSFYGWRTEYREALASYEKSLRFINPARHTTETMDGWFGKAAVHIELGEYEQAEAALDTGHQLNARLQFPNPLFYEAFWRSRLEHARGHDALALTHAQRAVALTDRLGRQDARREVYTLMGRLLRRLGQPEAAYKALYQAITAQEWLREQTIGDASQRAFSFTRALSPYHEMVGLLISQHKFAEAFAFAEQAKARALLEVLQHGKADLTRLLTAEEQAEEQRRETALRSLNLELTHLRARLQTAAARIAMLEQQQQQARLALEAFQTTLYAAHPNLKAQRGEMRPFNVNEAHALEQGEPAALLEYVVTDEQTFLFVLTPTSAQINVYEIPLRRQELAIRVAAWRQQLADRDPAFRAPARQLAELLLGPARAQLRGKTRLVIVPDEALWELPFQALLTKVAAKPGLGERFLIEDYAISYAPSLTVLREMMHARDQRTNKASRAATLLAFGNPALPAMAMARAQTVYRDFSLAPLPEAEREVKALAQLYGTLQSKVFTGTAARETQAKAEAGNYNILHFATHGILNDASPLYSHLLLAQENSSEDGLLEAREVLKLDLRAELVTLSACETARGKIGAGEGVIGLSWAFFVAGSPATLVSQWKVESASTTNLMLGFYQKLKAAQPLSKAAALRQAALQLMRSPDYKHPFYWAGFVLIGDGR